MEEDDNLTRADVVIVNPAVEYVDRWHRDQPLSSRLRAGACQGPKAMLRGALYEQRNEIADRVAVELESAVGDGAFYGVWGEARELLGESLGCFGYRAVFIRAVHLSR
ncbi:hypothetical protein OG474_23155 [Kribbella sp. NBC_01505]